ncbi:hypothetical protein ACFC1B_07215 [Streptomyces xiamenensis]|uniref:hypothetical protein n=1 Tax=Streptomyces xiamenensis TaxID=408015 RepID=UPI0035DE5373
MSQHPVASVLFLDLLASGLETAVRSRARARGSDPRVAAGWAVAAEAAWLGVLALEALSEAAPGAAQALAERLDDPANHDNDRHIIRLSRRHGLPLDAWLREEEDGASGTAVAN